LTTHDVARQARSPASSGRLMEQDNSTHLDPEMTKTWLKLLKTHLKSC
jgi:hypothetical protein